MLSTASSLLIKLATPVAGYIHTTPSYMQWIVSLSWQENDDTAAAAALYCCMCDWIRERTVRCIRHPASKCGAFKLLCTNSTPLPNQLEPSINTPHMRVHHPSFVCTTDIGRFRHGMAAPDRERRSSKWFKFSFPTASPRPGRRRSGRPATPSFWSLNPIRACMHDRVRACWPCSFPFAGVGFFPATC